ncbi:MAG TPA: hypothetical protein VGJ87_10850 [Roseiflexaceae bacterium]
MRWAVGRRLGDEQMFFVEGCQRDWDGLPPPDRPLMAGIDRVWSWILVRCGPGAA